MTSPLGAQPAISLLIVEDDPDARCFLLETVTKKYPGISVRAAENGRVGLALCHEHAPDVVITDINMPEMNGIEMAAGIKEMSPVTKIIAATALSETRHLVDAIRIGISRYVLKPIELDTLFEAIDDCLSRISMEREIKAQHDFILILSRAVDQSTSMVLITDAAGVIEYANPKLIEVTGYSMEEVVGENLRVLLPGTTSPEEIDMLWSTATRGSEWLGEIVSCKKNGSLCSLEISLSRLSSEAGGTTHFVAVMQDVTARKQMAEKLRLSEERFATAFRVSPDAINLTRLSDGRYLEISDGFTGITGFTIQDVVGKTSIELNIWADGEDRARLVRELKDNGVVNNLEAQFRCKDGSLFTGLMSAKTMEVDGEVCLLSVTRDISDRKRSEEEHKRMEEQMLHAQKLESLGVLAGGIAHDFNNILMAIIGNADLALMRINRESPAVENLRKIEQAAARAADLSKQMLAYSGKGRFVVGNLDLNLLLEEMLHMLEVSISKKVVLRLSLTPALPAVEADATQLRQIVMNLVINASEAIGDQNGYISVTTGCMDCERSYLKDVWLDEKLGEGRYVYLEVADTGCGMNGETLAKIFDPFFSTKFTGRGLGMAAVLGIVRGHRGAIKVYSEPGRGTTFKILLPATESPAEIATFSCDRDLWNGSGKVLLVDDEEAVRGIGCEMLKELGFVTLTACDGREALETFKNTPDIKLVVLDLTMPHMDGEQCFRELRALQPDVKVIMSSGYNEQEVSQKFAGKGVAGFVQKPYTMTILRDALRVLSV